MAHWDLAIIGGGAAGLSAAAEAAGAGLSTLIIDRMGGGGTLMNLGPLHDHDEALTGPDLAARMLEQAVAAGAELAIAEVTALIREGGHWRILSTGDTQTARTVILASGLAPGTLSLSNERDFEAQGLSHCAACDGPLYRGQPVVVAGAGRWAQMEARELAAIASEVALVTQGDDAPVLDQVAVVAGRIVGLEGEAGLEFVTVQPDDGGPVRRLPAQVVFVQTGRRPDLDFADEDLARSQEGRVIVDSRLSTNLPDLFAAGDLRDGAQQTIAAAIEDGVWAAAAVRRIIKPLGKAVASE